MVTAGGETILGRLAAFMEGAAPESLPAEVAQSARQRVLDALGICLAADALELGRDAALASEIAHPHFVELPQRVHGRDLGKAFLEGLSHFIHRTLTNDNGKRRGPSPRRDARIGASGGSVVRRERARSGREEETERYSV